MAIIKTLNKYDFIREFEKSAYATAFSREELIALYEFYEELSEGIGENIEMEVVSICGERDHYDSIKDILGDYDYKTFEEFEKNHITIKTEETILVHNP